MEECPRAFSRLKAYLAQAPILSQLVAVEILYMYLVVTNHTMSMVLIWVEREIQKLIYYVSKTL